MTTYKLSKQVDGWPAVKWDFKTLELEVRRFDERTIVEVEIRKVSKAANGRITSECFSLALSPAEAAELAAALAGRKWYAEMEAKQGLAATLASEGGE